MSEPIINGVPAGSPVPNGMVPVGDRLHRRHQAVNAAADQVGEPAVVESVAAARGPLALEAIGLGKDFKLGRRAVLHAVRNVRLSLYQGAVVALVGESGSGKSTVAKLLAGQERRTHGTIKLDGKPIEIHGGRQFRRYKRQVQYVFQDPFSLAQPDPYGRLHSVPPGEAAPARGEGRQEGRHGAP